MLDKCLLNDRTKRKALNYIHKRSTLAAEWGRTGDERGYGTLVSLWVPQQQPGEKVAWTDGGGGVGGGRRLTNAKKEPDSACFRKSQ